jgi:hypothetical protein
MLSDYARRRRANPTYVLILWQIAQMLVGMIIMLR